MTAVVGILNKYAVAVAADSAVTIGNSNNHKILNKANKIFTLSKFHPVGIMLYNSASFMSTPWETIIKIYRKQLGDKYFPTLRDYQQDFVEFLRVKNFFTDEEMQKVFLSNFISDIIRFVVEEVVSKNRDLVNNQSPENKVNLLNLIEGNFDNLIQSWSTNNNFCPEFIDYNFQSFEEYSNKLFTEIIDSQFTQYGFEISEVMLLKIKQAVFHIQKGKVDISGYTGLTFTGFGEEDIYPQLIPVNVFFAIENRLRYYVDEKRVALISNDYNGYVRPFAQTDVIDTILQGIDPNLDDIYAKNFGKTFQKYNDAITEILRDTNPELSKKNR